MNNIFNFILSPHQKGWFSRTRMRRNLFPFFLIVCAWLSGCVNSKINVSNKKQLPATTPIVVGPLANYSDTPQANRQVESMLVGLLRAKGFHHVIQFQRVSSCTKLLYCPDDTFSLEKTVRWARSHHADYVLTGATNEWRYKVGLDGEPVAGVSLILVNTHTQNIAWSAVGSTVGYSRAGLDLVGQGLLNDLLKYLRAL